MEKKLRILFEVLFVICLCGYYVVKVMIPEYREKYGSSDAFVKTSQYQNMFEVQIDDTIHFAYLLNRKKSIYHIFFFDRNAKVLYNRGIENHSIEDSLEKTFSLLIERNYIKEGSSVSITRYGSTGYSEFYTSFLSYIDYYDISVNVVEKESTLLDLGKKYEIVGENDSMILRNLDVYSKELLLENEEELSSQEEQYLEYAKNVYQKLEHYILEKKLNSFSKEEAPFPIQMIPAKEEEFYPTGNSWYEYQNGI